MRQYKKSNCPERAEVGQKLEVAEASICSGEWEECYCVIGFGNPETRKLSWVPYNSKVKIGVKVYTFLRGKSCDGYGRSVKCLRDENGHLHNLDDMLRMEAVLLEKPKGLLEKLVKR